MVLTTEELAGGSFRVFKHSNQNVHKQTHTGQRRLLKQNWRTHNTKHRLAATDDKQRMATESAQVATDTMEVELPPTENPAQPTLTTDDTVTAALAELNLVKPSNYNFDYVTSTSPDKYEVLTTPSEEKPASYTMNDNNEQQLQQQPRVTEDLPAIKEGADLNWDVENNLKADLNWDVENN